MPRNVQPAGNLVSVWIVISFKQWWNIKYTIYVELRMPLRVLSQFTDWKMFTGDKMIIKTTVTVYQHVAAKSGSLYRTW